MTRYVLDTDHVSLFQRNHPRVTASILTTPPQYLAVTIVTVEEQLRGRLSQVKRATSGPALVQAYARLHETLTFFQHTSVLDFDERAQATFEALQQRKIRIGTLDLRIAAITLSVGGILISRNRQDFGQIPTLRVEDWSVE